MERSRKGAPSPCSLHIVRAWHKVFPCDIVAAVQLRTMTRLTNSTRMGHIVQNEYRLPLRNVHSGQLWEYAEGDEPISNDDLSELKEELAVLVDIYGEQDQES